MKHINTLKRRIAFALVIIIMLCAVLTMASCKKQGDDTSPSPNSTASQTTEATHASPTPAPTEEPTPEPKIDNSLKDTGAMVLACAKLSFGLASNGRLSYMGSNEGQAYCYDWADVVKIVGSPGFCAGLTKHGTVLFSGADELKAIAETWENVTDITASDTALYALTASGKVLSTDGSADELRAVTVFSAGSDFLVCKLFDGRLTGVGSLPDMSSISSSGAKITSIACGTDFVCVLTEDNRLLSTKQDNPFKSISSVVDIFACGDHTAVIDSSGRLYTDCHLIPSDSDGVGLNIKEDVRFFSCSEDHALLLNSDGSVSAYGDNTYLQCKTGAWQLLPYRTDDGYILGLTVGQTLPDGSIVKTGDEITLPDGAEGIAVILGDIDMDGVIGVDDSILLNKYLHGSASLTAVQKRAANVYYDSSDPDSVDMADFEQLRYHMNGWTEIDQYAKDFRYSVKVAEYENINTDVVGYIKIQNTNIEGPLMYGDKFYYHTHNYAKTPTSRGSLYLYYGHPTKNIVITGHNLRVAGIMLHELHHIQDKYAKDYDEFENRVWYVNLFGETHLWEVFAMYEEKPKTQSQSSQYYNCNYAHTMDSMTDEEIEAWIDYQQERTELNYQLHVTPEDRFLTILTCADQHWESNQGGRIYFFLRRVDGH